MAFQNDTNMGRVEKMIDTLRHIQKSALSNRAEDQEVAAMLQPLTDELAALGIGTPPTANEAGSAERRGSWSGKAPQWASVHDMAEQADLKDLTVAMAVYINRIDEALS